MLETASTVLCHHPGVFDRFLDSEAFNQDLRGWNTSAVLETDNEDMFRDARAFNPEYAPPNIPI